MEFFDNMNRLGDSLSKLGDEINSIFNDNDSDIVINDISRQSSPSAPPPIPGACQPCGPQTPPPLIPPMPHGGSDNSLYSPRLERLIEMALADGVITDKERQLLHRKAAEEGVDPDEIDMVLEARLYKRKEEMEASIAAVPPPMPLPGLPATPPPTPIPSPPIPKPTQKYGDVRKCPRCGHVVRAFEAICPDCGHEFANVGGNSSIERLQQQLEAISTRISTSMFAQSQLFAERASCIANFPVPNTKGDLYEFIITSSNNIKGGIISADPESKAWKAKCHQCWDKARLLLVDDPTSLQNIQELLLEKKLLKYETRGVIKKERTGRVIWSD